MIVKEPVIVNTFVDVGQTLQEMYKDMKDESVSININGVQILMFWDKR